MNNLKHLILKPIRYIKKSITSNHNMYVTQEDLSMSALDIAIDIVTGNQVTGDYLEFGVYEGKSFLRAYHRFAANNSLNRRFFAFDSFEGLPESDEIWKPEQYQSGAYKAPQGVFIKFLKRGGVNLDKVVVIPGFYEETLTTTTKISKELNSVAVAYIDCDLYESAAQVFHFLTDIIHTGSIIVVDDWFRHRGVPTAGIQKACGEWLEKNPNIKLIQCHQYRRVAFIVHRLDEENQ